MQERKRKTLGDSFSVGAYKVELVREVGVGYAVPRQGINAAIAAGLVRSHIGNATDREHFVAVMLDCRMQVMGVSTVSIGSLDSCPVHARELFKPAILAGAFAVLIAHNHPSGDPTPSNQDIELTARMIAAGELLGIEIVDHLVISETRHYSMRATAEAAQAQA